MNQEKLFRSTGSYIAGTGLIESVNVALALEKPLLIKGEPGQGRRCWRRRWLRLWGWI